METSSIFMGLAVGLMLGGIVMYLLGQRRQSQKASKIISEAEEKAEVVRKEKLLQAKEKFMELKEDHEKAVNDKNKELELKDQRLRQKEIVLNNKIKETSAQSQELKDKIDNVNFHFEQLKKRNLRAADLEERTIAQLEKLANLSEEDAKAELVETLKNKAETEAASMLHRITEEARNNANKEAKRIVIQTIQRIGTEHAIENSVTVFNIENDDVKGKIIGREGRNIRALEAATGVELIIDDTPEAIVLSCFDPVRREIARVALHHLVADGRIHPARIEEVVEKTKGTIQDDIIETGKRTCIDLGIHGLHPELVRMVGRMKFRSSYGQNLLQHSREVANLCAVMSSELGLDTTLAKRAGLLHDIGKVPEDEPELPHALLGMKLAEKYGEKQEVCNAIGAHHDEIEMESLISPIVQVCDAISGARPGARREIVEAYMKRLRDLENLAYEFDGVTKAYAIQAGRELRVLVESDKVGDKDTEELSFKISKKIQEEMTYPGQVKITVIRETRAINFAR